MQDSATVLETLERPVYHVDSGKVMKSLMGATLYLQPTPALVLTRETSMPSAQDVTVSYMVIPGSTLEEWKRNMEEMSLMIWKPLPGPISGPETSSKRYENTTEAELRI